MLHLLVEPRIGEVDKTVHFLLNNLRLRFMREIGMKTYIIIGAVFGLVGVTARLLGVHLNSWMWGVGVGFAAALIVGYIKNRKKG
ncbi:MAG: hypothetical protein A2845_01920 [Candidatus Lloydbacteria bacterium RIFCSPHIGHO2_01_FULL_49_22]|uniref:Uncharacterized protein n=1 Tax=Candidatus Lloydbacteria bacterium RIFCSPHIGHO2_01_FULL_49_22 TaxID=1798658 RepID=A0A1G2CUF6_9BACT|nr:MAG: hypothetical protein A2845_01920 [Candidatus Lloydbacteria bacterium RIFCSPHIGHO2_01_FULL_49_22]OGZ09601.1 MAG: hypothetical protein A3C14_05895 [Candidatus Lloydbacteria bacterium RIFCSPHIGHO2_02_FULL_50_18]